MKKRMMILFVACLLLLSAPGVQAAPVEEPVTPSLTENLFLLFGAGREEAAAVLPGLDGAEGKEAGAQVSYVLELSGDDAPQSVCLTFYNDVLMACDYAFGDAAAAFEYAQGMRAELQAAFGEKSTYPGVTADYRGYFDDLQDASQLRELYAYYEDWTVQPEEAVMRRMIGETAYSRVDLRMELMVYPKNRAVVTAKYMVVRDRLGERVP